MFEKIGGFVSGASRAVAENKGLALGAFGVGNVTGMIIERKWDVTHKVQNLLRRNKEYNDPLANAEAVAEAMAEKKVANE